MVLPSAVDVLLRTSHEVAAAWELRRLHVDRGREQRLVDAGALKRELPGVLGSVERQGPPWRATAAALRSLRAGPGDHRPLALTGEAALAAHGLEGFDWPARPLIAVTADRHMRQVERPFDLLRDPVLQPVTRQGLPVAPVGVAIRDLARTEVSDARVRQAVDAARWAGVLHLPGWIDELRQRPRVARRLLSMADDEVFDQESEGERTSFRRLFVGRGPLPDCQVWVLPHIRADFAYLYAAIVVEYLGEDAHAAALQTDTSRIFAIECGGYLHVPVVKTMLADAAAVAAGIHDLRRHRESLTDRGLLPRAPLPPQPSRLTPLRTVRPSR